MMKARRKASGGSKRDAASRLELQRKALLQANLAVATHGKPSDPVERGRNLELPGFYSAPAQKVPNNLPNKQPSPEWLADKCIELLLAADTHTASSGGTREYAVHRILGGTEAEQYAEIGIGLRAAWECYKLADAFLLTKNVRTLPLPAFFSQKEIEEDYVSYERACVLMTGEPKPKRAMEKWQRYENVTIGEAEAEGREPPGFPEPYEWTPRSIIFGMAAYEKFAKKPIDLTKSQYAPHPDHSRPRGGQKARRRRQTGAKRGQK